MRGAKLIIITILLGAAMQACRTRYIEVPKIHTEIKEHIRTDSITIIDSVLIQAKNDTVYIERTKWRTRIKQTTDTITIRDTITQIKQIEKSIHTKTPKSKFWVIIVSVLFGTAIPFIIRFAKRFIN